jgi:hypothetical protein
MRQTKNKEQKKRQRKFADCFSFFLQVELRASENNKPRSVFAHLKYKIETGESERIAVDHIARVRPVAEGDRSVFLFLLFFFFV